MVLYLDMLCLFTSHLRLSMSVGLAQGEVACHGPGPFFEKWVGKG